MSMPRIHPVPTGRRPFYTSVFYQHLVPTGQKIKFCFQAIALRAKGADSPQGLLEGERPREPGRPTDAQQRVSHRACPTAAHGTFALH